MTSYLHETNYSLPSNINLNGGKTYYKYNNILA